MYIPQQFEETRVDVMHELIRAYPLATLVTYSSGELNANHIPLYLSVSPEPYGSLYGHIARANPLLNEIADGVETLVIFKGLDSYITPSWYATKLETGKVVPTWNYAVVHAYGILRIEENSSRLRSQLEALTDQNESSFPQPWAVSDAPSEYIEQMMEAIIGVEIVVTKMLGKWKVSQNQPTKNQVSLISGLKSSDLSDLDAMGKLVEARASNKR